MRTVASFGAGGAVSAAPAVVTSRAADDGCGCSGKSGLSRTTSALASTASMADVDAALSGRPRMAPDDRRDIVKAVIAGLVTALAIRLLAPGRA